MTPLTTARSLLAALDAIPGATQFTTVGPELAADLRALLAMWDKAHEGVGNRYACERTSVGTWTVERRDGLDLHLRGPRGEVWVVTEDFLAAELMAGRMQRLPSTTPR